jgi:hypothetical protein
MLIHGSYWDSRFPRLLTNEQLGMIQANPNNKHRLLSVADISCDIKVRINHCIIKNCFVKLIKLMLIFMCTFF